MPVPLTRGPRRAAARAVAGAVSLCLGVLGSLLLVLPLAACGSQAPARSAGPAATTRPVSPIAAQLTRPVRVEGGHIRGLAQDGVAAYLGIPFAAPPVGDLRWRPPQPVRPWAGVRRCVAYAPVALQGRGVRAGTLTVPAQSEDCLYLNVWTPARRAGERLPVMVWIHGGGFIFGSGSLPPGRAQRFVALHHVVLVSVNYRLGVFGFFAHPALSAESPHHVSGNYGLLDQIAALRWVRRDIAAFGGDPRRVTIFGQSAGGQSVVAQLVSPLSRGLFARAISESPRYQDEGVGIWCTRTLAQQEREGQGIARSLGVREGPGAAAELRSIPAERLLAATAPVWHDLPSLLVLPPDPSFQPVVDGYVLPDEPWDLLRRGRWAKVPLLIGSNQDEAGMWLGGLAPATGERVASALRARIAWYAGRDWPGLARRFPPAAYGSLVAATSRMMTVLEFNAPARYTARCVASQGVPAYLYYFSRVPPGDTRGAHHCVEIPYVFDSLHPAGVHDPQGPADQMLADEVSTYWARFAATGDPNGPGLPYWPRYELAGDLLLRLDAPVRVMKAPYPGVCRIAERTVRDAVLGPKR